MARLPERKVPSLQRRILATLAAVLLLGGVLIETGPSERKPSPSNAAFSVTPENDGLPSLRDFDFPTNAAAQTALQSTASASNEAAAPAPVPTAAISAPTVTTSSFADGLSRPDLKLAVADFPKIFNAYYKTKLARAEFAARKGDQAASAKEVAQMHDQLVAELKQVILNYSIAHDLDAVFDAGSILPTSGDPLVLYARPGTDITDGVIAQANAGHAEN